MGNPDYPGENQPGEPAMTSAKPTHGYCDAVSAELGISLRFGEWKGEPQRVIDWLTDIDPAAEPKRYAEWHANVILLQELWNAAQDYSPDDPMAAVRALKAVPELVGIAKQLPRILNNAVALGEYAAEDRNWRRQDSIGAEQSAFLAKAEAALAAMEEEK